MSYNPVQIGDTGQTAADKINSMFKELFEQLLLKFLAAVTEIRAIENYKDGDQIGLFGYNAIYQFDAASTAADDGLNVLKPDNLDVLQAGRWILKTMFADRDKIQNIDGTQYFQISDGLIKGEISGASSDTSTAFQIRRNLGQAIWYDNIFTVNQNGSGRLGADYVPFGEFRITNQLIYLYERGGGHTSNTQIEQINNILRIWSTNLGKISFEYPYGTQKLLFDYSGEIFDGKNWTLYIKQIGGWSVDAGFIKLPSLYIKGIASKGNSTAGDFEIDGGDGSASNNGIHGNVIIGANHTKSVAIGHKAPEEKLDIIDTTKTQGIRVQLETLTADKALGKSDHYIIGDATNNDVIITLPDTSAGNWHGQNYKIYRKDNSVNNVIVQDFLGNVLYDVSTNEKLNLIYDSVSDTWLNW